MAIKKTVYPHSADIARERGELAAYRESNKANRECAAAIDKAINDSCYELYHYDLKSAMQTVIAAYGEKRVAWVMAAAVRAANYDGRYSSQNKEWAQGFPVPYEQHYGNPKPLPAHYGTNAHPTLIDGFINCLREHLERIPNEAKKLVVALRKTEEPNSPSKTHFIAEVSTDFLQSASSRDMEKLLQAIPYKGASMSTLKGQRGVFVFISKEDMLRARNKQEKKSSVTGALKEAAKQAAEKPDTAKNTVKKKLEQEL